MHHQSEGSAPLHWSHIIDLCASEVLVECEPGSCFHLQILSQPPRRYWHTLKSGSGLKCRVGFT